jgi:1-acyl-sn-glycerol-3-phosphate acyltransferase
VDRTADDPSHELRQIKALTAGLGADDGVLIYPEGTRFTQAKRTRAIARLEESQAELAERARRMRYVLPPRIGGVLQLLDAGTDVLVCAHQGLGGFASVGDIWSGGMVGTTVRVRFWRIPAADVPAGREDRIDWLYAQWERIDDWIGSQRITES